MTRTIDGRCGLGWIAIRLSVLQVALTLGGAAAAADNWYTRSFYLLHEDHHTSGVHEVGRDADPVETARLINLSRPDVIQIHAKGNPGWTTYPSRVGHTPPKLYRDVMRVWREIADQNGYPFSVYYNIGRDGEIMKHHPEWNRSDANGREIDRALCYHSGVAEQYLWPMVREITDAYHPDGWWFDGSCFTVRLCYCDACRQRFHKERNAEPPTDRSDPNWSAYHEMQRQIYREFVESTAAMIHRQDPDCLVAVNWACSLRMPEKPIAGIDYLTGDIGNRVEGLSGEAHWYDGTGLPFDLMTQLNTYSGSAAGSEAAGRPRFGPKPPVQLEQEMAIVIANGGRFWVWDSPTPESGLTAERHEYLAHHVASWLRARQPWCLGTQRIPDVSLLNTAAAHYAVTDSADTACFSRRDNRIDGATRLLPRLHLNYEMVGDWRLHAEDVRSRVLIVEHPKRLTPRDVDALIAFVRSGGRLLLTGMGLLHGQNRLAELCGLARPTGPPAAETLVFGAEHQGQTFEHFRFRCELDGAEIVLAAGTASGQSVPLLTRHPVGKGIAYYFATPLLTAHGKNEIPQPLLEAVFDAVVEPAERMLASDAPQDVEIVLRSRGSARIVHLVNTAGGTRQVVKSGNRQHVCVTALPETPASHVRVRMLRPPESIMLQPQKTAVTQWQYQDGVVEFEVPSFAVHQLVVIE